MESLRSNLRELDDERHRALRVAEDYKESEKKARKKQRDIVRDCEDENQRLQVTDNLYTWLGQWHKGYLLCHSLG